MADPSNEPSRREPRAQGSTNRPRPAPLPPRQPTPRPFPAARFTPESIPVAPPTESDNVLDEPAEPTDDSPTVISRNQPRPVELPAGDLRGRHLAHFELIEQIGVGGMAAVLRAHDTQLDRDVALKILPPDMAADAENVRRFHQEARSAARLDHENIARVFFCGEDQSLHFIAFEFVEGENLRIILERRGRLPVSEALPILIQITAGLAHAAERSVVHRDIKPSNIILTPTGRAKLVDMGLARTLERKDDKGLTHSGVTLGTFDYISPEQALEPRDADVRSDIYSLGCTFYHMLTGRPPVPEGTAARKLHHHQHVKPTDPRELVPETPDEVVLVLSRMMAKRPEDRYRTAGELLQALLACARQVHVRADAPEGVLILDAPQAQPSRARPLLLAALAVAAVIGLVFLLEPTGSAPPPAAPPQAQQRTNDDHRPSRNDSTDPRSQPPGKDPGTNKTTETTDPNVPVDIYDDDNVTGPALAKWLEEHRTSARIEVILARSIEIVPSSGGSETAPFLVFSAKQEVVLRPKNADQRPTIRLKHGAADLPGSLWPAVTVESPTVRIENIRFVLDAEDVPVPLVGLLQRGGKCTVKNCEFIQARVVAEQPKRRLASVVVEPSQTIQAGPPSLSLEGCTFLGFKGMKGGAAPGSLQFGGADLGGLDAVVRRGPVAVTALQCAFGPHANVFRLEGDSGGRPAVSVQHCTVLAGTGTTVFRVADGVNTQLGMQYCLITRAVPPAESEPSDSERNVVLRQDGPGEVSFQGQDNRYFGLDAFWTGPDGVLVGGLTPEGRWPEPLAARPGCGDARSLVLKFNPMHDDRPLARLEGVVYPADFEERARDTFRIEERLRDLRRPDDRDRRLIGVETFAAGTYLGRLPSLDLSQRRVRVVDPSRNDPSLAASGFYPTLRKAVEDAQSGDEIRIRSDSELAVHPIKLERDNGAVSLTIRPEDGYRPVLTLSEQTKDLDAALFHVPTGCKLTLENLTFRLHPNRKEFKFQTVAALMGDGDCSFQHCLFTLEPNADAPDTRLAAAVVTVDPSSRMPNMPKAGARRVLRFEDCFVRGKGDLVWGTVAQPCTVEVRRTAVALSGSLLDMEIGLKEEAAQDQDLKVQLENVTAYLGGNVLRLSTTDREARLSLPVHCVPKDCLFVAVSTAPMVYLRTADSDVKMLTKRLSWEPGNSKNAYGYGNLLELDPIDGGAATMLSSLRDWRLTFPDDYGTTPAHLKVAHETSKFPELLPAQLTPDADVPANVGARLDQLMMHLFPAEAK
jgi:serine/threonine protein kinase